MIQNETVFILGAGASVPYGFPLGERLVINILSNLSNNTFINPLVKRGFSEETIAKFTNKLKGSNLKSIDAFLENQNDDIKLLGKVAIAQELIKSNDYKHVDSKDDWYKEVWNAMYTTPELIGGNKISFISFNYDLSLEHYLHQSITSSFDLSSHEVLKILSSLKIVHLHGKIGYEPWDKSYQPNLDIVEAAKGIKIISDEIEDDKDFIRAHGFISQAQRIYFIGFGYHPVNIDRLKIKQKLENKLITGSTFGLTDLQCSQIENKIGQVNILCKTHGWGNLRFLREKVLLN